MGEALLTSWIPTFGSAAFLIQMFASRPQLSTFLIRDVASSIGRRVPIYGGADSRTEIALIRSADWLIEAIQITTLLTQRIRQRWGKPPAASAATQILPLPTSTRWSRWLETKAMERIALREAAVTSEVQDKSHADATDGRKTA